MALRIKRLGTNGGTRICLSGELRGEHLVDLRTEVQRFGPPATLDLDEVNVVDLDGIRWLNECRAQGIHVLNCSPYIREWMLQEKRVGSV